MMPDLPNVGFQRDIEQFVVSVANFMSLAFFLSIEEIKNLNNVSRLTQYLYLNEEESYSLNR